MLEVKTTGLEWGQFSSKNLLSNLLTSSSSFSRRSSIPSPWWKSNPAHYWNTNRARLINTLIAVFYPNKIPLIFKASKMEIRKHSKKRGVSEKPKSRTYVNVLL
jgi:hypothetical protein